MSARTSDTPRVIFTLASARSGTLFLRTLFRNNIPDCVCRHEPFFDWGNPAMFGPAIYDAWAGRVNRIRERLEKKRRYIVRHGGRAYLESSHAFLKSSYVAALEVFPDLRLIHLVRDPLLVSKSEADREHRRLAAHAPFHYYKGDDGRRHFCWSLTTNEAIYQHFDRERMSLFQKYLVQWIEIENRAMAFLQRHQLRERCFTLGVPRGLNDPAVIASLFDFLGLQPRSPEISMGGRRNASLGYSAKVDAADEREWENVLAALPGRYLEIFQHEPYTRFNWSARFRGVQPAPQNAT